MKRSMARWTTALAATALLALPAAGVAQTPAGQPPTSTQPPAEPPATQPPADPAQQPGQVDPEAAKEHLTAARNALSEMTQLPAAQQLTGEARTHVSELITNFNELITTKAEWRNAYVKVESNLSALLGSATTDESAAGTSGTAGAVGTSGTMTLDAEIKAKLTEFRNHLEKFEEAAGNASLSPSPPASGTAASPATGTSPAQSAQSGQSAQTGMTQSGHEAQTGQIDREQVLQHVRAIEAILNVQAPGTAGTTGTTEPPTGTTHSGITLSPTQVDQLRTHLSELKRLLEQR